MKTISEWELDRETRTRPGGLGRRNDGAQRAGGETSTEARLLDRMHPRRRWTAVAPAPDFSATVEQQKSSFGWPSSRCCLDFESNGGMRGGWRRNIRWPDFEARNSILFTQRKLAFCQTTLFRVLNRLKMYKFIVQIYVYLAFQWCVKIVQPKQR